MSIVGNTKQACLTILVITTVVQFGCNQASPVPTAAVETPAIATDEVKTDEVKTDDVKQDAPSDQGRWAAKSATLAGNPFPAAVTESISLDLTGDQYVVMVGEQADKGTFVIDTKHVPKRMTIKGIEGPNAGQTFLAIFDFPSADEMRVCYELGGSEFPTGFDSTAENGLFSVVYTRKL